MPVRIRWRVHGEPPRSALSERVVARLRVPSRRGVRREHPRSALRDGTELRDVDDLRVYDGPGLWSRKTLRSLRRPLRGSVITSHVGIPEESGGSVFLRLM